MKAARIGTFAAKTHLSDLLEQVRRGRTFLITKRGQTIAELRPVSSPERRPRFGCLRGRIAMRKDFDAPIPDFGEYTR